MCGRAAQSVGAVVAGRHMLESTESSNAKETDSRQTEIGRKFQDDVNLSPGHRAIVFHEGGSLSSMGNNSIEASEMIWGLVPRGGSKVSPLPVGPSQHFANLMFNARADTLYQKRTFRELALTPGRTCIWAVDGFYEWKESDADAVHRGGGKQPYYVHRSDGLPLLVAGLWTSVNTGREPDSTLHTFTAITTDACPVLHWLHTRMPLILWDTKDCLSWLRNPSPQLEQKLAHNCSTSSPSILAYHPVSKKMNKTTYRASNCSTPIKIEKLPTLQSFFPASKKVAKQGSVKKTTSSMFPSRAEHEETKESGVACPASPMASLTASLVVSAKKRTAQTQVTPLQSTKKTKVLSIKKDFFSPKTSKQNN